MVLLVGTLPVFIKKEFMTEETKKARYGISINFFDNQTKEDVQYSIISDNIVAIEEEIKRMLKIVKDK